MLLRLFAEAGWHVTQLAVMSLMATRPSDKHRQNSHKTQPREQRSKPGYVAVFGIAEFFRDDIDGSDVHERTRSQCVKDSFDNLTVLTAKNTAQGAPDEDAEGGNTGKRGNQAPGATFGHICFDETHAQRKRRGLG